MRGPIAIEPVRRQHASFLRRMNGLMDRSLELAGEAAKAETKGPATGFQHRTRNLGRGTHYKVVRSSRGRLLKVRNRVAYAAFVERGTRPHVIRARRGRFLRFTAGGRTVFARQVQHPGTKPTWFLKRATAFGGAVFFARFKAGLRQLERTF